MRYLVAVVAVLLLSGCAADLELAERQRAIHGPGCERLGLLSGTEGYGDCVMWRSMVDDEQRKAELRRQSNQGR